MTPHERLRHDLLIDCAAELDAKKREIEELKFDNACLQLQSRMLWCRLRKLSGGNRGVR